MRLSSTSSQFVFNLPSDFLPQEIVDTYTPILEKNWVQYSNVIDYLNSTIKGVNMPGLAIDTPEQIRMRGKMVNYKPSKNVQDIVTTRNLDITFRSVDQDLNYFILWDIFNKHYLDTKFVEYIHPVTVKVLDIHRDALYEVNFRELIMTTLSENNLQYNDQAFTEKTFTVNMSFNWIDIEFLLNRRKVLETDNVETPIIQILPQNPDDYRPTPTRNDNLNDGFPSGTIN